MWIRFSAAWRMGSRLVRATSGAVLNGFPHTWHARQALSSQTASAIGGQIACSRLAGTNRTSPQASLPLGTIAGHMSSLGFREISVVTRALVILHGAVPIVAAKPAKTGVSPLGWKGTGTFSGPKWTERRASLRPVNGYAPTERLWPGPPEKERLAMPPITVENAAALVEDSVRDGLPGSVYPEGQSSGRGTELVAGGRRPLVTRSSFARSSPSVLDLNVSLVFLRTSIASTIAWRQVGC